MANTNTPRVEVYGVKGLKSTPFRKTFNSYEAAGQWAESHDAEILGYREHGDHSVKISEDLGVFVRS